MPQLANKAYRTLSQGQVFHYRKDDVGRNLDFCDVFVRSFHGMGIGGEQENEQKINKCLKFIVHMISFLSGSFLLKASYSSSYLAFWKNNVLKFPLAFP